MTHHHHDRPAGVLAHAAIFTAAFAAGTYAVNRFENQRRDRRYTDSAPALARRGWHRQTAGRTVTINKPRPELYAFWRDLSNMPRFMKHVERVATDADGVSIWTVDMPGRGPVDFATEIIADRPNQAIAWRSTEDAAIDARGLIEFADAPGDRGTLVTARIVFHAPMGALGRLMATVTQRDPAIRTRRDLKRLKMLMETGEIARADMRNEHEEA